MAVEDVAAAAVLRGLKSDPAIVKALLEGDPVEATLKDVDSVFPATGGRRRKLRGGGPIADALKKLREDAGNSLMYGKDVAEGAIAKVIASVPAAIKTATAAVGIRYAVEHPSLFANIVELVRKVGTEKLLTASGVTWEEYGNALVRIAGSAGQFGADLLKAPSSPGTVILTALVVMKYRAGKSTGGDVVQLIKNDAAVLKKAAGTTVEKVARAATGQYAAFLKAHEKEAAAKPISQLRELALRTKTDRPAGEGAEAMRMAAITGAPSAESGAAEGLVKLVPASEQGPLANALQAIVNLPESVPEEKAAAAVLLQLANPPEDVGVGKKRKERGGKKKTRRAPRRRVTRRKFIFAY